MKQFAIIGLDFFGKQVLDELLELGAEVLVIDRDTQVVDNYKDSDVTAYVLDVLNADSLKHILPATIDGVVIDLGHKIEASILTTSYCRKLGIKNIVVKAETEAHAEILEIVGATRIIFPNREAAKRIAPLLLSSTLLSYLPVGGSLVIAEVAIPDDFYSKTILEVDIRKKYGLNLISVKNGDKGEEYAVIDLAYRFRPGDIGLFSGTEDSVAKFSGQLDRAKTRDKLMGNFKKLFNKSGKK